ncbi:uncharacterized protein [Prorops nasuta]|uniref:uncharacterized protein n=1 Tax=Prorops nasuta TaxID=863751 RepID=UPI0034CDFAB6
MSQRCEVYFFNYDLFILLTSCYYNSRDLDTPTSCEDYSSSSSEHGQQNPGINIKQEICTAAIASRPIRNSTNTNYVSDLLEIILGQQESPPVFNVYQSTIVQRQRSKLTLAYSFHQQVAFVEEKCSSGAGEPGGKSSLKLWTAKGTPKIVRAIRRGSKKLNPEEDRSVSLVEPRADNSKSSVVILYHGKSPTLPSTSSKQFLRSSKSDQTISQTRIVHRAIVEPQLSPRKKAAESPEELCPIFPIHRRKTTIRRYRRASRRYEPVNVNIYHESRVVRVSPPVENCKAEGPKNKTKGSWDRSAPSKDAFRLRDKSFPKGNEYSNVQRKTRCYKAALSETFKDTPKDSPEEPCQRNILLSKLMAHYSNTVKEEEAPEQKQPAFSPNLGLLMQQAQTYTGETDEDGRASIKETEETKRTFPFQATPSGNLKIIPNQVVYECEKLSVLVADPQATKINVELNKQSSETSPKNSELTCRPEIADLPPGVTASTIHQLQIQKKLPDTEVRCRPRTQPYKPKGQRIEMEEASQATTCHRTSSINEVPLSSLGFTDDQPIDWDTIILPEKTDLYQELARRIVNYKNADCIVRIGDDEFYCHLLVLQSYSTFFDQHNCKEIDLTGSSVTSKAFSIVYDWMISLISESCHLLRRDNILEIFTAAQYLGIKELEEQCWAFIDNDELFSEDTAFLLYLDAKKVGNTAVMELMIPRIMKFFLLLVSTKDFLELTVDELCSLLRSNYICVNSEMEVLMSAVRWLMHDWKNRQKFMLNVLRCVRFGLIAPWQLVDVKRNPENPEFMELMSYPEVQKMVDDGLAFVIIKYWYSSQTEDYYRWIELLGLTEPTNRNWAGKDKNYVTYQEFLLYLEECQRNLIPELKSRKQRSKPSPPNSPPSQRASGQQRRNQADPSPNHCCGDTSGPGASNTETRNPQFPCNMPFPSEMLKTYFTNVSRSDFKGEINAVGLHVMKFQGKLQASNSRRTLLKTLDFRNKLLKIEQRLNEKSTGKIMADDSIGETRLVGGGNHSETRVSNLNNFENSDKEISLNSVNKLDVENSRERIALITVDVHGGTNLIFSPDLQEIKMHQGLRHPAAAEAGSVKSEEEADTATVEATRRSCKTGKRISDIKETSSKEKQSVRKVAELLALPGERSLHRSLNQAGSSAILTANFAEGNASNLRDKRKTSLTISSEENSTDLPAKYVGNTFTMFYSKIVITNNREIPLVPQSEPDSLGNSKKQQINSSPIDLRSNDVNKAIRVIKSPAFSSNGEEKSNSLNDANENVEENQTFFERHLSKVNEEFAKTRGRRSRKDTEKRGEECDKCSRSVQVQVWDNGGKLPLRISSSMLADYEEGHLLENSLYFNDREAILLFGGVDPYDGHDCSGNNGKDIYRFVPSENTWQFVGEIPEPRHRHAAAYLKGRIYIVGGVSPSRNNRNKASSAVGTVWSFDPTTRAWYNEPTLITPRKDFGLIVSHGKMFVVGGRDKHGIALSTVEAFDPTRLEWKEMQPMYTARVGPASVKYRDLIWVAGGMTKSKKELEFSKDVECYDPIKNLWFRVESLISPRCFASMYVLYDRLYIIGGVEKTNNTTQSLDCLDVWDWKSRRWATKSNMFVPRHGHCVGSIGDKILIIGGITASEITNTLESVECYSSEEEKWVKGVSPLPRAIANSCSVSLPSANLLRIS